MHEWIKFESCYCKTHSVRVCLDIAYIACGSASLYIKSLYFFLTVLALSAAATVANIKIRYDAKTPRFAIFGHVSYVWSTAFVFASGDVFWIGDETAIEGAWNTFGVTILPDLDGDGIPEVLLPHGGDPKYGPNVSDSAIID